MAYDDELAERVREVIQEHGPAVEKGMFGGLGFMLDGHMAVCVSSNGGLLVRVTEADGLALAADDPNVAPMAMGARTSRTWLHVQAPALSSDDDLATWVARGVAVVRGLPPKG